MLIWVCRHQKQFQRAEDNVEKAATIFGKTVGETNLEQAKFLDALATESFKQGDLRQAAALSERSLDIRVKIEGQGVVDSDATRIAVNLGDAYRRAGNKTKSRYFYQLALRRLPSTFGDSELRRLDKYLKERLGQYQALY